MLFGIIQQISSLPISSYLTIAMLVLLGISFLFGLLRGVRKSFFYTIFYLFACAFFFLSLDKLTMKVLYSDISSAGISIADVSITSLAESMPEVLRSLLSNGNSGDYSNMFVPGTESFTLMLSLLGFGVQIALCLGFIVFFQIAYKIIVWLLWITLGRWMFKMKYRENGKVHKKKKHRILGGFMGLVPGCISVLMLFIPLSGFFSVASSMTNTKNEGVSFGDVLSEDDYKSLQKAIGSYEESVPGKIFNIAVSSDGRSLDLWAFDKMITVNVDGNEFNIRKDLENIGSFASNIMSTGLLSVVTDTEFTANELIKVTDEDSEVITSAFESLGEVELIDLIMNTGVEFLDSSRLIDEKLELQTDSINYNNLAKLDWSNEFKQLGNILISGIEVLDALNDTDKNKPFNEISFSLETLDSFNAEKTEKALNNFIDELFESNLVNEGTTAGLEYIFGMSQVKDIVGEIDKEELKKIDLKSDLLKVTSAIKSVINISVNNFTSVNLQELSNQSIELKNIIDEVFDLEIFKLVEENVIDYAITNYVETNENILKFVNVDELRELRLIDFKIELGAIVETFGKLGEQTEIFIVEGLEDNQKINLEAVNSKALRLINENLAKSDTIYKFIDDVLHGVLVPSIFEDEEEYNDLISNFEVKTDSGELDGPKTREKWTEEINVFVNMLEAIEEEMAEVNEVFSVYAFATSENKDIKLGMLRGMTAKDKENTDEYLLDESILVSEVMINMINDRMEGNEMFDGVFDDDTLSYGLEIDTLVKIMVESNIVEDRNDAVISPSSLEDEFTNLNDAKLTAFSNNIDNSRILQKVLRNALKEVVSNDLYLEMDSWGDIPGKWSTEMHSLRNILIDGGFANEEGNIVIEEMGDLDSVNYVQLDAISLNIDNSEILQDVLATTLIDSGFELEDKDSDGKYDVIWSIEFAIIRDVVGSETYQVDGEWSKMSISELSELNCIRPETLVILSKQINDSSLLKNALKDPLKDLLKNDDGTYYSDPETWTNEEWSKELKSIAYVTIPLATKNAEKEANGYPSDRVYIDINNIDIENEIKLAVLENVLGGVESDLVTENSRRRTPKKSVVDETNNEFGINHSSLLRKLLKDALESSINVEDTTSSDYKYNVDFDSFTNNQYYYEVEALINVIKDAKIYDERDNVKYININTLSDKLEKITKELVSSITGQVANSIILRKQMQKNLEPTVGEEFAYTEMNSWSIETWQDEMVALDYIVFTLEEDDEGAIDLEIEDEINVATVDAISEKHYSLLVREMMISSLDEDTEQDMSSWENNPNQWKDELHAIDVLANELAVDGKINLNDMSFEDEYGNTEVKVSLLSSLGDVVHGSTFVQEKLNENLFTDENYKSAYPSVEYSEVKNQWNDEVNSLYNVINGTSYVVDGYFYPDNIDFENDIDIKLLENLSTTVHKSAFLQSKLDDGLFNDEDYKAYYPVVAYSLNENQWNDEVESLYNVINGTSYVVNNKFNPNDIDFGGSIDIKVIDNISKTVHKSAYLQSKLDAELFNDEDYKVYYPVMGYSEIENQWNDEMASLYNTINGTSYVVDGKVDPNSIDFSGSVDIEVINNISKTVHKSAYLQSKLDAELFNDVNYKSYYPVMGHSSIKNQWNDEMESLYNTIVGTSYVVDGKVDPNAIDFGGSIDIRLLENTSLFINNSTYMQGKIENALFTDVNYQSEYPEVGFSKEENQWNDEMSSLYNVMNGTSYVVDNKIDIDAIDFENSIDIQVLDNISNHVHKSAYLQSKLDGALFTDANYQEKYPEVDYSIVENRWNAEIGALYSAINGTSYVVDGAFDPNGLDFNSSIDVKILLNISENIHESTYLQSKLDTTLFTNDSYKSEDPSKAIFPIVKFEEEKNQWNDEIKALYNVINGSTYVDSNCMFSPSSLNITGVINVSILANLKANISKSTYLQYKLEATLEDLIEKDPSKEDVYLLDRVDVGTDYNLEFDATSGTYVFDLVPKFNDSDYVWRVEVGTMVDIILDPRSNVVDLDGNVDLHHISEGLHDFSIDMLSVASDKLDSNGHTTYGSSKIIRLNLVKPLEILATEEDGGVIIKDGKYVTRESLGFKWIDSDDGTVPSDLHDLNEFFSIIGATTHSEAVTILETLTLASLTPAKVAQLADLASRSYYIGVLVYNHGLSI